ncbi:MAG: HEPN domain-containing protein [Holophagaceae bacterium]|nr:HEPN domain-containing protein [Holophagaceae bacterium]
MAKAWVEKAEADYGTAQREIKVKKGANFDAVCLHAELCAERYLKARLAEDEIDFPSTRHIVVLLMLCLDLEPGWEAFREQIRTLSSFAIELEDPDMLSDEKMGELAMEACETFRTAARKSLGLK